MGVMETIVPILKGQIGEINWKKSKERAYINDLHAFINDPAIHFEINRIDNIELKSIAAFILKGQSYNDCMALCKWQNLKIIVIFFPCGVAYVVIWK